MMDLSQDKIYFNKLTQKSGYIFNIQKFSIHDGSGIRTLVFFKGCPLECAWCSNPESQNLLPEVFYTPENCVLCKKCQLACRQNRIKNNKEKPIITDECYNNCENNCIDICPAEAMKFTGEKIEIEKIISKILDDKEFYNVSNGGVTISGGEPFHQPGFLFGLIRSIKSLNIHIAVETCGFFEYEINIRSIMLIDTFLYDLKLINRDKHILHTGRDNRLIIENLFKLISDNKEIIVRIPLIRSANDTDEDINDFLNLLKKIRGNIKEVNILPYHKFGIQKYKYLGRDKIPGFDTFQDKKLENILIRFKNNGINTKIVN